MRKKFLFGTCLLFIAPAIAIATLFCSTNNFSAIANPGTYLLQFSSSKNKISSSEGTIKAITDNGGMIDISYKGITSNSAGWQTVAKNGYISNEYQYSSSSKNKINSLESILVNYSGGNLCVGYGYYSCDQTNHPIVSGEAFDFNQSFPSRFKLYNSSSSSCSISSITLRYTCENKSITLEEEKDCDNYRLFADGLSDEKLTSYYSKAISYTDSELNNYNSIEIEFPKGSFVTSETISFLGKRNNNKNIILDGNGSSIYNGEQLSTGNWSLYQNGIYYKDIGIRDKFSTLIVDGNPAKICATPVMQAIGNNEKKDGACGYYLDADNKGTSSWSPRFTFELDTLISATGLSTLSGEMLIAMQEKWAGCIAKISSVNISRSYYTWKSAKKVYHYYVDLMTEKGSYSEYTMFGGDRNYRVESHPYFSLMDNIAFLDSTNEFYYDQTIGRLYYIPNDASSINSSIFIIPSSKTLLDTSTLAEGITFRNFKFIGSNSNDFFENSFLESQATVNYEMKKDGNGSIYLASARILPGLININSSKTTFINCEIVGSAGSGINVSSYASDVIVNSCRIKESYGCGLFIGEINNAALPYKILKNVSIVNCEIDGYGLLYKGAIGISATYVDTLNISQNTIHNGSYTGISAGWGWTSNATTFVHKKYTITYNKIYDVVVSKLYDGAPIYVLGGFNNALGEIYNEIAYNYLEYHRGLSVIYLDESSTSYYVHNNACKLINNEEDYMLGTIFNHNPIQNTNSYYTFCHSNKIENNYVYGSGSYSYNYTFATNTYYSGGYDSNGDGDFDDPNDIKPYVLLNSTQVSNLFATRKYTYENPIITSSSIVKEAIYYSAGSSIDIPADIFSSKETFLSALHVNTEESNISIDATTKTAYLNGCKCGFYFYNEYLQKLYKLGYRSMSFDISATSIVADKKCESIIMVTSGGTSSWNTSALDNKCSDGETIAMSLSLKSFVESNANALVEPREAKGISGGQCDVDSNIVLSNIRLSKMDITENTSITNYVDTRANIVSSDDETNTYSFNFKNVSYNYHRLQLPNTVDLYNRGFRYLRIEVSNNNHCMYIFKGSNVSYDKRIYPGGGFYLLSIDNSDTPITLMTCHEAFNSSGSLFQDDSAIYGSTENINLTYRLLRNCSDDILNESEKYIKLFDGTGYELNSYTESTKTISANCTKGIIDLSDLLINNMKKNQYNAISFDVNLGTNENAKRMCTVISFVDGYVGGNKYPASFLVDSYGVVHVHLTNLTINAITKISFVFRNEDGYSQVPATNFPVYNVLINNVNFN